MKKIRTQLEQNYIDFHKALKQVNKARIKCEKEIDKELKRKGIKCQ